MGSGQLVGDRLQGRRQLAAGRRSFAGLWQAECSKQGVADGYSTTPHASRVLGRRARAAGAKRKLGIEFLAERTR